MTVTLFSDTRQVQRQAGPLSNSITTQKQSSTGLVGVVWGEPNSGLILGREGGFPSSPRSSLLRYELNFGATSPPVAGDIREVPDADLPEAQ